MKNRKLKKWMVILGIITTVNLMKIFFGNSIEIIFNQWFSIVSPEWFAIAIYFFSDTAFELVTFIKRGNP